MTAFSFGPRRGTYTDISETLATAPQPLSMTELGHFETLDLIYRSLCALLYNYVPTSGHPGGSISSGRFGPLLVGKDTRMPDLLIMLSTLGGISVFGAVGFVIGPVVAALFLTVWQIYGVAFEHLLSARAPAAAASAGPPED